MKEAITERKVNCIRSVSLDNSVIWWLLAASLFTVVTISVFVYPMHHDVAFFVYQSGCLIDGGRLYQDTVSMNPPLISFWAVPSVWVARLIGWSEITLFKIYQLLVVVLSFVMCRHILMQILQSTSMVLWQCFLLVLVFVAVRPHFFGQREHIMFVTVMPYILAAVGWAMKRPLNWHLRLFIGLVAGGGLVLKPHFLLLWLMIESYLTFVKRISLSWRRPENIGIAIFLVSYGAFVVFCMPEYHEKIIPLLMQTYGAFNCSYSYLFQRPYAKLWGVVFIAFFLVRPTANSKEIRRILLVASMSFLLMAFLQRKGFYYHFYPAAATSVLLLTVMFLDSMETVGLIRRLAGARRSAAVFVIILGLFVLASVRLVQYAQCAEPPLLSPLIRLVQEHAKGKPILLFSSSMFPAFPLVNYSDARWSSRHPHFWFLPGLYADVSTSDKGFSYHTRDEMDALERLLMDEVVSDILKNPPVLLIADCSPIKQGFGRTKFDYIQYYLQDPRFAEFWTNYEFLAAVEHYKVFKQRRDLRSDLDDLY